MSGAEIEWWASVLVGLVFGALAALWLLEVL